MTSASAARDRLCDPVAEVSAHWLIDDDGRAEALVAEDQRAWHAGAGSWQGVMDVNSRSIGIEIANPGDRPFAARQMDALEILLAGIMARWTIPPQSVIAHSDLAPDRKIDPGPHFDWARLARGGLSIWPNVKVGSQVIDCERFKSLAQMFGYPDAPDDILLSAFRLRFRPRVTGPLDGTDMAMIADLAARFGTDGDSWRAS